MSFYHCLLFQHFVDRVWDNLGLKSKGILDAPTAQKFSSWSTNAEREAQTAPAKMTTKNLLTSPGDSHEFDVLFEEVSYKNSHFSIDTFAILNVLSVVLVIIW